MACPGGGILVVSPFGSFAGAKHGHVHNDSALPQHGRHLVLVILQFTGNPFLSCFLQVTFTLTRKWRFDSKKQSCQSSRSCCGMTVVTVDQQTNTEGAVQKVTDLVTESVSPNIQQNQGDALGCTPGVHHGDPRHSIYRSSLAWF